MAPDWLRVQEVFLRAVELPTDERYSFLDSECGADSALRQEVESLLSFDSARDDNPIPTAIQNAAQAFADGSSLIGARLGPWRILKRISQGGMGLVYLAERDDGQYSQKVALKLIRPGFETGELLQRFRRERQILAQLKHPYIAHLIDGGIAPDGRPFLVMEYVEGDPIGAYARTHNLGVNECCRLFSRVCEAVSYAQSNGVVHRDLKPANILVCADGSPRLLDFGIAKLLDAKLDAKMDLGLTHTVAGWLMTPEYASPEQILGQEITPATDVYCLGGVLYTLLTGSKPHQFASGDPLEIRRVICDTEVPRPSSHVDRGFPGYAARRKLIEGDLDAIILKAMRKEAPKRYPSAEALREDVSRHLEKHPVTARKNVWTYRAGRFVSRHRTLCVTALVIPAAIATVLWFAAGANRRTEARRVFTAAVADLARHEDIVMPRVIHELQQSLALDPDYAPAYAALAEAAIWMSTAPGQPKDSWESEGRKAASRALQLDPRQPHAHAVLGDLLFFRDWNWTDGERELRTAAVLEPARSGWQVQYVKALTVLGRFEDGLDFLQKAERDRPGEVDYQVQRALLLLYLGRYQQSIDASRKVIADDPNGIEGVWVLGMAMVQNGQIREGVRVLESGLNRHHRDTRLEAALGNAYGVAGDDVQARRMLGLIIHPPNIIAKVICYVCGALIYAGMGDADNAMAWLYKARDAQDGSLPFIPADPRYSRIARDPRFVELKRQIRQGLGGPSSK